MPKIDFRENKTLKLVNVLSRKVPTAELFSQDKQVQMLYSWVKAKGYESLGPLLMYSSGITGVDAEGAPIINNRVMTQLKNYKVRLEVPYRFENDV